jgi:hypothetical protein
MKGLEASPAGRSSVKIASDRSMQQSPLPTVPHATGRITGAMVPATALEIIDAMDPRVVP